jgi:hypothetical protein
MITAVTLSTKVKSLLWVPSPFTGRGTPPRAARTKVGTAAAYAWPAGCNGPKTLKSRSGRTSGPKQVE